MDGATPARASTPEIAEGDSESRLWLAVPGDGRKSPNSPAIGASARKDRKPVAKELASSEHALRLHQRQSVAK
jgi:hypothetical protein